MTWEGRRLTALTGTDLENTYTYNLDGLRTKKTVNGDTYTYHYNGSLLMMQELTRANGTVSIQRYSYDSAGNVVSVNYDGEDYYYLRNAQNDVVEILDNTGASKVLYQYDSWGRLLKIQGSGAWTIGRENPFRYRGYYYDTETELYYLQSRYYDPEVGRFINADGYVSTGQGIVGNNIFAYCGNNPVNRADPSGQFWIAAAIVAAVAAATVLTGCSANKTPPSDYIQDDSKERNCYTYAFNLEGYKDPGSFYADKNSSKADYMYKNKDVYTTKEITDYVMSDMKVLKKSVRVVSKPSDKKDNEYIVAMKTTDILSQRGNRFYADYHFAVQLSDGSWADKPGRSPSRWGELDGTAIQWDWHYNSESVYFAVER